jgi:hypothetical protein
MDYSAPAGPRWKLALGSLTSGDDHLYSERLASGGDHLCTDGSPAAATTFAPVACRRRRPPQRVRRGPHPCPPTGMRTRPSKNAAATSTAYDVLYAPRAALEQCGRWCRGRYGCGGPAHGATVARAVDGQPCPAWRREAALEAAPKPSKPKRWSRSTARFPPQRVGARGMEPWLSPLSTFTRPVIILPPRMLEEEAGRSVASMDIPWR